jgi:hypothetical protein
MPGANELSTVEWHSAQVMPRCVRVSLPLTGSTVPLRPTTAPSLSSATVVSGLVRLMVPFWMPCTTAGGSASASTLSPTDNAVVGSTALRTTSCMCSVSVQKVSSPKVSKRKICLPFSTTAGSRVRSGSGELEWEQAASAASATLPATRRGMRTKRAIVVLRFA